MSGGGRSDLASSVEAVDAQRELAAARHERGAVDADRGRRGRGDEQAVHRLGAEHVDAGLELDAARAVVEIQERHLALAAARRQTPGDAVRDLGLLARRQPLVGGAHRRDRLDPANSCGNGSTPAARSALELAPAVGENVGALGRVGTSSGPSCSPTGDHRREPLGADVDLGDLELALRRGGVTDRRPHRRACGR